MNAVIGCAALVLVGLLAGLAVMATASLATGQGEEIKQVASEKLPNVPGKSVSAVVVSYAPGGKSVKHHHAGSVLVYVLSGEIRSESSATGPAEGWRDLLRTSRERASRQRERKRDRAC